MEYLSDNATAQTMLNGFYSGPITLKEGHDGSLLPDPNDPLDQEIFKTGSLSLVHLSPLWLVFNKNRPLSYTLDLSERDGPCNITLDIDPKGVVDEYTIVDVESGGTLEFSLILNDDMIPGFPFAILGLITLVTVGVLIKKHKSDPKK